MSIKLSKVQRYWAKEPEEQARQTQDLESAVETSLAEAEERVKTLEDENASLTLRVEALEAFH